MKTIHLAAAMFVAIATAACGGREDVASIPSEVVEPTTLSLTGTVDSTAIVLDNAAAVAIGSDGRVFSAYLREDGSFQLDVPIGVTYRVVIANTTPEGELVTIGHVVNQTTMGTRHSIHAKKGGKHDFGRICAGMSCDRNDKHGKKDDGKGRDDDKKGGHDDKKGGHDGWDGKDDGHDRDGDFKCSERPDDHDRLCKKDGGDHEMRPEYSGGDDWDDGGRDWGGDRGGRSCKGHDGKDGKDDKGGKDDEWMGGDDKWRCEKGGHDDKACDKDKDKDGKGGHDDKMGGKDGKGGHDDKMGGKDGKGHDDKGDKGKGGHDGKDGCRCASDCGGGRKCVASKCSGGGIPL